MASDFEYMQTLVADRIILGLRQADNAAMLRKEARIEAQRAKAQEQDAYKTIEAWDRLAREAGLRVVVPWKGTDQEYGYGG